MPDVLLLIALLVFVAGAALLLKSRAEKGSRLNSVSLMIGGVICFTVYACGGDKPEGKDTDTILSTDNYTIYITREDIDSIENDVRDSSGIIMTRREYKGMQLFMAHCNECHPGGNAGVGPALNDKPLPDFLVHFQIRQGMGDMPAFKEEELSKDEVKQIVLFVRQLRENYKAANQVP